MKKVLSVFSIFAIFFILSTQSAFASHSWSAHWGRTANPFTLKVGDNLSTNWDPYLVSASSDWSSSTVLDMSVVAGSTSSRSCKAKKGQVEVCNYKYGKNGWLGLTQIWTSGGHITQSTVKMNDTYFNTSLYNKPEWRIFAICHELGHTIGLDHQDENFTNTPLGTCLDYSNDPLPNQHPNSHDYEQLLSIYSHLDSINTVGVSSGGGLLGWGRLSTNSLDTLDNPSDWGETIRKVGRNIIFERDLGFGQKLFTFITLAE